MSFMRTFLVALVLSAIATLTNAAPPSLRVLLPIYFEKPVQGAYGSLWQSRFTVRNASAGSYIIDWCSPVKENEGCQLDLVGDEELRSGETQTALPGRYPKPVNGVAGAVVYLDGFGLSTDPESDLTFQLRVADLSRSATSAGTEVPVVREKSFRTATFEILDVPVDPRFRLTLRVFEMNLDRASFAVRVLDQATNAPVGAALVKTFTPPQGPRRFQPGFGEVTDLIPATVSALPSSVRLEIEPLTRGSAFWAYVSVTNNESQQVTLATPQ
jgi:hypothetical protein